jgi:hypothetical protein
MRTPQKMLEIMPVKGPGTTCHQATMFGITYHHMVCSECIGNSATGTALPDDVFRHLTELIELQHGPSDCSKV